MMGSQDKSQIAAMKMSFPESAQVVLQCTCTRTKCVLILYLSLAGNCTHLEVLLGMEPLKMKGKESNRSLAGC